MSRGITDRNRSRKTYSFYRARPAPTIPVVATAAGGSPVIKFTNITQMLAEDVTNITSGEFVFVASLRDFFFLEKDAVLGSANGVDQFAATPSGVWYRTGLGGQYWKNQTTWWIDSSSGSDENMGNLSGSALATHDELTRRLFSATKISDDYIINFKAGTAIVGGYAVDIEMEGGSVTYRGEPTISGSALGTITTIQPDVSYVSATLPTITSAGLTGTEELLYVNNTEFLGWRVEGSATRLAMTELVSGSVSDSIKTAQVPAWSPGLLSVRGHGYVRLEDLSFDVNDVMLDQGSFIEFSRSKLAGPTVMQGGKIMFDHCLLDGATSGSFIVSNHSNVCLSGSAIINAPEVLVGQHSTLEMGASCIYSGTVRTNSSRMVMSLGGTTGVALVDTQLDVGSDSIVDVKNVFSSGSLVADPIKVSGQNITIFYDDVNVPKADTIDINNGTMATAVWAGMPYSDLLRGTRIVSGALNNTWDE